VDDTGDAFNPDPAHAGLYADDLIPHALTDTPEQFNHLPSFLKGESAAGTVRWRNRFGTEERYQENVKRHHRLIHGVDVQIGRILDRLDTLGVSSNTVVVFSSDNGFFLGERQQAGKWYIPEESIRVPLIVHDPRLPRELRGRSAPQMALNLDLPATLLDYAGVPAPAAMQGRSLRPVVEGLPVPDWRTEFFFDHPAVGEIVFASEGVRTRDFAYARYPRNGDVEQLFDVTLDPWQRTNLARDPRYAPVLEALRARTTQLKAEAH
jgi:arylsulfatase A-like enzyme